MSYRENKYTKNFFGVKFKTPFEMVLFYDENLRECKITLHPWEIEILKAFGENLGDREAIQQVLRAANGSGKSQFILAPCIIWLPLSFDNAFSYVTSSSAQQLDTQTERYCDYLIKRINEVHRKDFKDQDIIHAVKRKKHFLLTDSFVDLIATDEGSKAEGKHPLVPDAEFAIFVDEGKSIDKEIYDALDRCTGYTRRLDASSPGERFGHFYDINTRPELGWDIHVVTAHDCPHISQKSIEKRILQYGINDPLIRSSIFAEFTSVDSQVVIKPEILEHCIKSFKGVDLARFGQEKRAGLDLSAGGDELVLSIWLGNEMIEQEIGRFRDTTSGVKQILHWIRQNSLDPINVKADDGGIGKGMIDLLHLNECYVKRKLNNAAPFDKTRYRNRGSESWFNLARFVEYSSVKFLNDPVLHKQLTTRFYEVREGKIKLMSKAEAKANGQPSPDRADSAVLAWDELLFSELIEEDFKKLPVNSNRVFTEEGLDKFGHDKDYSYFKKMFEKKEYEEAKHKFSLLAECEEASQPRLIKLSPLKNLGYNINN